MDESFKDISVSCNNLMALPICSVIPINNDTSQAKFFFPLETLWNFRFILPQKKKPQEPKAQQQQQQQNL